MHRVSGGTAYEPRMYTAYVYCVCTAYVYRVCSAQLSSPSTCRRIVLRRAVVFDSETHRQAITIQKLQVGCWLRPCWRLTAERGAVPVVRFSCMHLVLVSQVPVARATLSSRAKVLICVDLCRSVSICVDLCRSVSICVDLCRRSDAALGVDVVLGVDTAHLGVR
jgi:hypothetical protein